MKFIKFLICLFLFLAISIVISPKAVFASTEFKPPLSWQRSTEDPNVIITETALAQAEKLQEALNQPLDPAQAVFDNGKNTPEPNKSAATAASASWASWPHNYPCLQSYELRHFQAKFNLASLDTSNIEKVKLVSPSYPGDVFPINDNAYVYLNGHEIARLGSRYITVSGSYTPETDGVISSGDFGTNPIQFLQIGKNTIDIITEELCGWGGMGKLDLVFDLKAPPGPTPFLDLPWDYKSKGLTFNDAALAINSYFDHEYPLLSSGLGEPVGVKDSIVTYKGFPRTGDPYSSHDGYDYGIPAEVRIGDPVLAAADGVATLGNPSKCGACGNHILINHGNGYQTRYFHLQDNSLIVNQLGQSVNVVKGQQIGRVGASGHVEPSGPAGAHIHFMVIQDKNNDGNFDDNIPDGVTDPFGWQSTEPDPWPNYQFNYAGQNRTGDTSYYLWTQPIANLSNRLTTNGGFFELEHYSVDFPQGAANQDLNLEMKSAPTVQPTNTLQSIGSTIVITAKDLLGNFVKVFDKTFTIKIDFSTFDLSTDNLATISIYSSEDGVNWNKEQTNVDLNNKTATAQVNHLTQFALMAERKDTIPPTTSAILAGDKGQEGWFKSNVQMSLNAQDNTGGLGVDYTLYQINDGSLQQYTAPITFSNEGTYTVQFYSLDKGENAEQSKSITFHIDKTPPEAKIFIDQDKQDLVIAGIDQNQTVVTRTENKATKKKDDAVYIVTDQAGNTLKLDVRDRDKEKQDKFKIFSTKYNNDPPILEPSNDYNVFYQGKKDKLNVKEQNFEIKDDVRIRIAYDQKKNKSTIFTKQNGKEKVKEVKPGLVLLKLTTNKGNLEYSY